jgi:triple functional domain protein
MLNVPKKANDVMHLSLLEQCDISLDSLGEVVLQVNQVFFVLHLMLFLILLLFLFFFGKQDSFLVWDTKQLIRKGRERHVFLFDLYILFSKEVKDTTGTIKYIYKTKLLTSGKCFL